MVTRRVGLVSLAAFLLLITPFVVFLRHYGYPLTNPEILLSLAAAALAAMGIGVVTAPWLIARVLALAMLVTLAFDIQVDQLDGGRELGAALLVAIAVGWTLREHLSRILVLMTGSMLLTTVVLTRGSTIKTEPAAALQKASDKPFVLHLVLDEHIGVDGFPKTPSLSNVAAEVKSFFGEREFLLFGRAYSEHFVTRHSISQLLNLSFEGFRAGVVRQGDGYAFQLTRNEYFAQLAASGYAVEAYQSNYINVCPDAAHVARCEAYDFTGIGELENSALQRHEKLAVIAAAYAQRLTAYRELEQLYSRLRARLARSGIELPSWPGPRVPKNFASLAGNLALQQLSSTLLTAQRGQYVFAHIMAPHSPYVYGPDCNLRPPTQWIDRTASDAPTGMTNTAEDRAQRYALYGQQIRCTYRNLANLLEAIPESVRHDAIIIVHGDHGSRINVISPTLPEGKTMTDSDYADAYSTLFAVRSRALGAGYDDRVVSITCLLAALHKTSFASLSEIPSCNSSHKVFLLGDGENDLTPVALPDFWHRRSENP